MFCAFCLLTKRRDASTPSWSRLILTGGSQMQEEEKQASDLRSVEARS